MTKLEAWEAWCTTAGTGQLADRFTLENSSHGKAFSFAWDAAREALKESHPEAYRHTIAAIDEALAEQPAQPCGYPYCGCNSKAWCKLERMAENARALGLDYEPPCKTGSQCTNKCPQCDEPAQQQEPVAYDKTEINCFAQDLYDQKMREGKRGHYESMFHVIHQCIKKVSPPASKPWQGLTDEDIGRCFDAADDTA